MIFHYFLLLCALASPVWSNSTGAPKDACGNLTPQHGVNSQTSPAPYSIAASSDSVKAGDSIKIIIRGNSANELIKGFLVQARVGNNPVGTFSPGPNTQTLDCKGSKDSITHKKMSGDGVNEVSFNWNPPSDLKGPVSFTVTVVQTADVFWVGKLSKSVNII